MGLNMSAKIADAATSIADATTTEESSCLSEVDAEVIRAIRNIRYGSVEITIHDSRVVQIERKEKRRFERSQRGS
jgi:hypothetical protein